MKILKSFGANGYARILRLVVMMNVSEGGYSASRLVLDSSQGSNQGLYKTIQGKAS